MNNTYLAFPHSQEANIRYQSCLAVKILNILAIWNIWTQIQGFCLQQPEGKTAKAVLFISSSVGTAVCDHPLKWQLLPVTGLCEIQPSASCKARSRCSSNKNWFGRAEAYWGAMHTPLMLINNLQGFERSVHLCVCVRASHPWPYFPSSDSFNKCVQIHWFFIKLQMRKQAASNQ